MTAQVASIKAARVRSRLSPRRRVSGDSGIAT
jgi:hypothetical protein